MSDAQTLQEEDGFHEIQLNGKQLVFLGMTTTLVSVVIFLCGVLVGRGVKPVEPIAEAATAQSAALTPAATEPAPAPAEAPPAAEAPTPVPAAAAAAAATPPATTAPPATAESKPASSTKKTAQASRTPAPVDELSYYDALAKGAKGSNAKGTAAARTKTTEPPAPVAESAPAPAPAAAEAAATPAAAAPRSAEATTAPVKGGAIAVQVAALSNRAEAEAIARRLSGKGYAAYVLTPDPGAKAVFKVRVGNYASAEEAARVSQRLRQEEKLQPWVIR